MEKKSLKIKIKKLVPEAVIPTYAKIGDAGMDLTAISKTDGPDYYYVEYGTGLAVEIPEGHVGLIFPRSSATKTSMIQGNCVGVIDSNYRGELKVRLKELGGALFNFNVNQYNVGERIAQLLIIPIPSISFQEVDELSETNRGDGGFGSTGY